jgi:hypothetical protein
LVCLGHRAAALTPPEWIVASVSELFAVPPQVEKVEVIANTPSKGMPLPSRPSR